MKTLARFCVALLFASVLILPTHGQLLITEFLTSNKTGLKDEDGEFSDWIEIYNSGDAAVNLENWSLTDNLSNLQKWRFPATNLAAKTTMLIFASDKNRSVAGRQLHTSFALNVEGEALALVSPDGQVHNAFAPAYPPQVDDVSYGIAFNNGAPTQNRAFFSPPTPGAINGSGMTAVAPAPVFSTAGRAFTNSLQVELTAPGAVGASIRYTTDGTEPTATSTVYTGPLLLRTSSLIRARTFAPGAHPSPTRSENFACLEDALATFSSNLPLAIISTFGRVLTETKSPAYISFTDTTAGRAQLLESGDLRSRAMVGIRGSSSTQFPKKSYSLELQDEKGDDRKTEVLGLPAESDWVLYAPYTDKTLMRDVLAYEWSNKIGRYAPRTRFFELYVSRGPKVVKADYVGVYVLIERIRRDANRVDIEELQPSMLQEPEITGGYIFKKDRLDPGDSGFSSSRAGTFAYVDPKEREMPNAQKLWLRNWLSQFENALYGANSRDPVRGYAPYINVDSFIDHHWMVELCRNIDGFRLSTFFYKDRLGKLNAGPIWDYNLSLGNANYLDGNLTNGWYNASVSDGDYPWFRRLFLDPDFNQKYIDRWWRAREREWSLNAILSRVDEIAGMLDEAQQRNYEKWRILGTQVWPNWYVGKTYSDEVSWMKGWITGRINWIDRQFLAIPKFSQPGGLFTNAFALNISAPTGTIYYTLDGTDPRGFGGTNNPAARLYNGPITISRTARVFARAKVSNSSWSGPTIATYATELPPLVITELMYAPVAEQGSLYSAEEFEYVELQNIGSQPLDLRGVRFTAGIDFSFTDSAVTNLPPGELVVIARNTNAFLSRYARPKNFAGPYLGALENNEERVRLEGALGEVLHDFTYTSDWHATTAGMGFALAHAAPASSARKSWDRASGWRASKAGGSPGELESAPAPLVVVSEVLANPTGAQRDSIELQNLGTNVVDVSGWFLTDNRNNPFKYRIPAGTTIGPGAYLVFTDREFNMEVSGFGLNGAGEEVYVFAAGADGKLTGHSDGFAFGAAGNGVSVGRVVTTDHTVHSVPLRSVTLSSTNDHPRISPIRISQIRYANDARIPKFVEIENTSASLVHFGAGRDRWRVQGIDFYFPDNATLAPGERALITSVSASAFATNELAPPNVKLLGPFVGTLSDDSDSLRLQMPILPNPNEPDVLRYLTVDEVSYRADADWPAATNAQTALHRDGGAFGHEPLSWRAGRATPGYRLNPSGEPLVALAENLEALLGLQLTIQGFAADDGTPQPLKTQWTQVSGPGQILFTNSASLSPRLQFPGVGDYRVRLAASDGAHTNTAETVVRVRRAASFDEWKTIYFTATEQAASGVSGLNADPDRDGFTNSQEFTAGTHPRTAVDLLRLDAIREGGQTMLRFRTAPGVAYRIDDLRNNATAWTTFTNVPAGNLPGEQSVPLPALDTRAIYRLRAE